MFALSGSPFQPTCFGVPCCFRHIPICRQKYRRLETSWPFHLCLPAHRQDCTSSVTSVGVAAATSTSFWEHEPQKGDKRLGLHLRIPPLGKVFSKILPVEMGAPHMGKPTYAANETGKAEDQPIGSGSWRRSAHRLRDLGEGPKRSLA